MNSSFTSIKVKNFRGFKDAFFSFKDTEQRDKPFVVVYGQNGAGKTSLARLFDVLPSLTLMVESRQTVSSLLSDPSIQKDQAEVLQRLFSARMIGKAKDLIDENKTIGTDGELMEIEYRFRLGQKYGFYRVVFSDEGIVEESLSFRLKARPETIFSADKERLSLNEKVFLSAAARASIKEDYARSFGQASMLGIVYSFVFTSNEEYRERNIDGSISDILDFFSSLAVRVSSGERRALMATPHENNFLYNLQGQKVSEDRERIRPALEVGLTAFFYSLSYNLESVEYRKIMQGNDEVYRLFFNERHGDDTIRSVPFSDLSSGTQKLLSLFFTLYNAFLGRTTVIDEVDNGIHDLIIANILSSAYECEAGQLIFTTHNTLLMKKLPKSCINFIDEGPKNETSFYSLDEFGRKVQDKTDVVGRYLDGLYGGAPFPNVPSMRVIKEMMDEKLNQQAKTTDGK